MASMSVLSVSRYLSKHGGLLIGDLYTTEYTMFMSLKYILTHSTSPELPEEQTLT